MEIAWLMFFAGVVLGRKIGLTDAYYRNKDKEQSDAD